MKPLIRIIGGLYRGKKISVPDVDGLRPTPNRVRETLFNWLMNDIRGARCLDAFAGTGALGLEAFSRGAESVYFIEQNNLAFASLKTLITSFNSKQLTLIHKDANDFIRTSKESFDIIFLDPPFNSDLLATTLETLEKTTLLKEGGLVYIESAYEIIPKPAYWNILKLKKTGMVFSGLLQRCS